MFRGDGRGPPLGVTPFTAQLPAAPGEQRAWVRLAGYRPVDAHFAAVPGAVVEVTLKVAKPHDATPDATTGDLIDPFAKK